MFPSITVCNMNQIEASFMKQLNASGNIKKTNALIEEFILGHSGNVSHRHRNIVNEVNYYLDLDYYSFPYLSSQKCEDLFIRMTFCGNVVTWRWFSLEENLERYYYPTDFGQCCMLVPHLDLEAINFNLTSEELYFNLVADSTGWSICFRTQYSSYLLLYCVRKQMDHPVS